MSVIVLDASAILAFLWKEPGWDRVHAVLDADECFLGAVNVAEVLTKAIDRGMPITVVPELMHSLDVEIVPMDANQAVHTALLREQTRHVGLSIGDRACLALAHARRATALTADRAWTTIDVGIVVECIRPE